MLRVKKILAPTDLSELSACGIRYALEMAKALDAEVIIHNVVGHEEATPFYSWAEGMLGDREAYRPFQEMMAEQKRLFDDFIRGMIGDTAGKSKIRPEIEFGVPHRKIVEKAEAEKVDLIVMSTHGRTGVEHLLLGSVAEQVVRRAPCPVLTIRPNKTGTTS